MRKRVINGTVFLEVCHSRSITSTKGTVIDVEDIDAQDDVEDDAQYDPQYDDANSYGSGNTSIAIFRAGGKLFACSNICPHQHAPILHEGVLSRATQTEEPTVTCPLHGWTFSLKTGLLVTSPTTDSRASNQPTPQISRTSISRTSALRVYQVFEEDGYVYVEKPKPSQQYW